MVDYYFYFNNFLYRKTKIKPKKIEQENENSICSYNNKNNSKGVKSLLKITTSISLELNKKSEFTITKEADIILNEKNNKTVEISRKKIIN